MALYRTGTAAMDAQGVITGTGTKWREPLSLIRTGATIVFLTTPLKLAVISDIVSDTEMKAIQTDGEPVANVNYVILLNDSLTVDGMAQDVAETLRYYQSKETVIEEVIEFFKNFDLKTLHDLVNNVNADAQQVAIDKAATEQLKNETNQIKADTNAIKTQTQQIKDSAVSEIGEIRNDALDARDAAENAQFAAEQSNIAAGNAKQGAETARDDARQWAQQVNPENFLHKDQNLSDLSNKESAKSNLGLDRFKQSEGETMMYPATVSPYRITIRPNGEWGTWRDDTGSWEALKIEAGGTGSKNEKDARRALNVPSAYKNIPDGTNILGWFIENNESGVFSSGENVINKPDDGHGWWTYNFKIHLRNQEGKPEFGVVEATSSENTMYIIVLTNGQWPHGWFKIARENDNVQFRDVKLTQYDTGFSGHLDLYNIKNNNQKGLTQLYNEFQDGVLKTTLRSANLENGKSSYLQWDENGSLWNVNNFISNEINFGYNNVRKLNTRHGTLLVDGTATPYYYTFGNPDGRRSVSEVGTVEDGWIFYGQVNRDLSKQLDVNGVVNAHAFNQGSDRDLKENIEVIDNAIERIRGIGGYTYILKEDGMPYAGVIAQEVRNSLPEASGSFTKYVDLQGPTKDGSALQGEERFYSVDYSGITALLVQACKELDEKITKLEHENKLLKESLSSVDEMRGEIEYMKSLLNKAK
ncbi:tail fiber domain-containing protein [Salmonella enterica subsp. enterica serovar Infantis]|uniref:tail fiber domain-containing protein n=1 Tax=Salmonella enterica TaxID=28901 RepID=UPI00190C1624|nr:tail fiber domain-containing protein [Salmonella enterica]MBK0265019.1 tail fiber domain-containing protein [Salmonella enterica subsp. enterica serovar Infantis]